MDQQLNITNNLNQINSAKVNIQSSNQENLLSSPCQGWFNDIIIWGQQTYKKQFDSVKSTIYNSTMGYFHSADIMRHILVEIPDNSKILDIGIGTGYVYSYNSDLIKRKNIHVTGIDTDEGYIKSAKHIMIDADLESNMKLIVDDLNFFGNLDSFAKDQIEYDSFDFIFFIDSYSVIPDVHSMITFCEKYLNASGTMVVASVLFDEYDENIDWIKQHLVYVSSVQFGNMMLKNKLEEYIRTRCSTGINTIKQCFRIINSASIPGINNNMKTYIVKWHPDNVSDINCT